MKILISIFVISFLFTACSFKSPENKWQYNSANAFSSYTKNFLISNDEIGQDDLSRSIKYAKQSANLEQLSRIYLGVCALNISVGIDDECKDYKQIKELVLSKELESYFLMIQNNLKKQQIKNLPKQYQEFSKYKSLKKYHEAFKSIENMKQISSKFLAASLIKNKLNKTQINWLIEQASFYGLKKIVLYWLHNLKKLESNKLEKEKLVKKIKILES